MWVRRCVPGPGDDPERDLGLADGGVVGQEPQVRPKGELEPSAEREAVDGRDRDLGDLREEVGRRAERVDGRPHLVGAPLGHRFDVGARGEDAPAAPQDEGSDLVAVGRPHGSRR